MPAIVRQIIDGWATQLGGDEPAEAFWSQLHGRLMLGGDVQPILDSVADAAPAPARPQAAPVIIATAPAPQASAAVKDDVTLL